MMKTLGLLLFAAGVLLTGCGQQQGLWNAMNAVPPAVANNPGETAALNGSLRVQIAGSTIVPGDVYGFGPVQAGSTSPATECVLQNNSAKTIIVSAVTISGSGFVLASGAFPAEIAAGAQYLFTMTASPVITGQSSGQLQIASDDSVNPVYTVQLSVAGMDQIVYVSMSGNDSSGDGSKASPVATMQKAIGLIPSGQCAICVAEGAYTIGVPITISTTMSLYGGYQDGTWLRKPSTYVTTLESSTVVGTTANRSGVIITDGSAVTGQVVISGFTISAGGNVADQKAGIVVKNGAAPFITGNVITAGTGAKYGEGIAVLSNAAPVIALNVISGGECQISANGILCESASGFFRYNRINGGKADSATIGLNLSTTTSLIQCTGNIIIGGQATSSGTSKGLFFDSGNHEANVVSNYILAGAGDDTYAVHLAGSAKTLMANNTIISGNSSIADYGVYSDSHLGDLFFMNNIVSCNGSSVGTGFHETATADSPECFLNNNFYGCAILYHDVEYSNDIVTVAMLNSYSDITQNASKPAAGNVSVALTYDSATLDIVNASDPAYYAVTRGGLDGTVSTPNITPVKDQKDVTRTGDGSTGWSMGAREYD
jgi:hypothetical protein